MLLLLLFVLVALVCSSPPSSSSPLLFRLLLLLFLLSEVEFVCVGGSGSGVAFVGGLLLHKKKMVCKVTHSRTVQVCVCVYSFVYVCVCDSVCAVSPFIYFYDVSFLAFY